MAASTTAGDVVVDAALVVEEVFVHGECGFSGAVVVELGLDAGDIGGVNDGSALALVLDPGLAGASAGLFAGAGVTAAGGIGPAGVRDDTGVLEVLPNIVKVTTVAAVVVGVAGDGILRSEDDVLAVDAESVGESLGGTEGPA